jgi:hypothetical protein
MAIAAHHGGGMKPSQPVHQALPEQSRRKPRAAFGQYSRHAASAKGAQQGR